MKKQTNKQQKIARLSKFGLVALVRGLEEYDFENLDQLPKGSAVIFVVATHGEKEPTDNTIQLIQNLTDETFEFSNGSPRFEWLNYVVFGLGNKTHERYNAIARIADRELEKADATRIDERCEGDDDKRAEVDYLDELESHLEEKVYLGELSARALTRSKGIYDAEIPFPGSSIWKNRGFRYQLPAR